MNSYPIADAHVEFIHRPEDEADLPDPTVTHEQITPDQIDQVQPELLFLACWIEPTGDAWSKLRWVVDGYRRVIKERGWRLVEAPQDLTYPGTTKIILHVEDLAGISEKLERISALQEMGVRSIGLTHNPANQFAGGSLADDAYGLTELGREAMVEIFKRQLLLDWAHLNERSVLDVAAVYPSLPPFISHCGLRAVHPAPRNVSDKALEVVRDRQGWVGVGMAKSFLTDSLPSLDHFRQQVAYATEFCGENSVGIGSDLGGVISGLPEPVTSFSQIKAATPALASPRQAGTTLLEFLPRYWAEIINLTP